MEIKVIIADDHLLLTDGLEQIINAIPGFKVVSKVGNGKSLMQVLNTITPTLILLDINMPYLNGIDAAKKIRRQMPEVKIVFLSMYFDAKLIATAKNEGIRGFLLKDITAPELRNRLQAISSGVLSFDLPQLKSPAAPVSQQDSFANELKLSQREIEIIRLIRDGMINKEISNTLKLSIYTIETHRKNIYRKLNLYGIGELISFANAHGI